VLGLQHAKKAWLGWAGDELRLRTPAAHVDCVVRWSQTGIEGACQRGPAQTFRVAESLPTGDRGVSLVEDDERANGCGDVADECLRLLTVEESLAQTCIEVVLAESGGSRDLAPVLDHRQLMWGGQFLQAGEPDAGRVHGLLDRHCERTQCAVMDGLESKRIELRRGQVARRVGSDGVGGLAAPDQGGLPVAADLLPELHSLLLSGRDRDAMYPTAADALLDSMQP
jgi:hypothetical protein